MLFQIFALWGCMPEIARDCVDMTNASSTYLSIALGAIVGAVVSWWIYNMQKKTSVKQDETLRRISELEENHDKLLKSIHQFQKHQDKLLSHILNLDKKIDTIIEKEER
jgi:septal ring factor EnvC (AmiA/AmiB activator)